MKFHKIKGVEKTVCTAEQKIAYNYAFSDYDWAMKSDLEFDEYLHIVSRRILDNENMVKKYNVDAIIHCLRQGFINYCKSTCHILTSYEDIGKMFPSLYPVE